MNLNLFSSCKLLSRQPFAAIKSLVIIFHYRNLSQQKRLIKVIEDVKSVKMSNLMIRNNRMFSLRFTIGTIVTFLILSVSGLTLAITYFGGMESIHSLSKIFTRQIGKGIANNIDHLFKAAEESGNIASFSIGAGIVNPNNEGAAIQLANFVLSQNANISSVDIATPDGSKYKASREINGSVLKRSDVRTKDSVIRKYYSDDISLLKKNKNTISTLEAGYDARTRPWFKKAVDSGKSSWTDIYVSGSEKQFVYSFTKPVYDQKGQLLAVVAIDLQVTALSQFLTEINLFDHAKSFILNDQKQIIAYPSLTMLELEETRTLADGRKEKTYKLYTPDNFPDHNLQRAMKAYESDHASFFEFTGDDKGRWLGLVESYPYLGGMNFLFGVYFPESSIMAGVYRNTLYIFSASSFLLIISILFGNYFAQKISTELSILSKDVERAGRLDIEDKNPTNSRIIEIDSMDSSIARMKVSLKSFKKYVPLELVRQLNVLRQEAFIGGEKQCLTVFFSDIANFTDISEGLPPEILLEHLSDYFDGMSREILSTDGTLDKYIGDSVMAFWGAPVFQKDHANRACHAALACKRFTDEFCRYSLDKHKPIFRTRMGIHTGEVVVGNIGNHERMNYTIIGDSVNLASRLEGLNKHYNTNILLSSSTYELIKNDFVARKLDLIAVKGRAEGLLIYELIANSSESDKTLEDFLHYYNFGLECYLKRSWNEALSALQTARSFSSWEEDIPSRILIERCQKFLRSPPPHDWNGIFKFDEK